MNLRGLVILSPLAFVFCTVPDCRGQVPVRYTEGVSHGFLTLRTPDGRLIAEGESTQTVKDGVVKARLTFRFKDGSLYEDRTTYSQNGNFRLSEDHLIQKGPAFKVQMESTIHARTGRVTVHFEKDGKKEELEESMTLPADLGNGMLFTLAKNLLATPQATVSYLAFAPKPVLVKLVFHKQAGEKLKAGSTRRPGARFLMKVEIGGLKGVLASLLKKKPPDTQMWILDEEAPAFVASEGPLYGQGPVWRIDLVSPARIAEGGEKGP